MANRSVPKSRTSSPAHHLIPARHQRNRDALLSLNDPSHKPIARPSSGMHITYYAPARMDLLDPDTSDGRVIFFLLWEGGVVSGTTDTPTRVNAQGEDMRWVIDEVRGPSWGRAQRMGGERRWDGRAGAGGPSGLITIAGGKWATYRAMGEETVDEAVEVFGLKEKVKSGRS